MIIYMQNQDLWRTMTALQESIKFYNDNNLSGKYDRALQKEKNMLKFYMNEVKLGNTSVAA